MKILVVSDCESRYLWDYYTPDKLEGIDLILSCGDVKASYLSFLATFAHCPVLYVRGNHDDRYEQEPPLGCICIDGDLYEYNGLRILGLGGSMRYNNGVNQYTEKEMNRRERGWWTATICATRALRPSTSCWTSISPPCFSTDTPTSITDEISPGRAAMGRPG